VHGDLEDGERGLDGAIDGSHAGAVPTAADAIGAFAAIPNRCISLLVETPGDKLGAAERRGKRRHT
jgi:hypothetical protein